MNRATRECSNKTGNRITVSAEMPRTLLRNSGSTALTVLDPARLTESWTLCPRPNIKINGRAVCAMPARPVMVSVA